MGQESDRGRTRRTSSGGVKDPATATERTVTTEYLSVLATSWLQALGPHLRALVVPPYRWGHSHAIASIALSVFAIESLAARSMHFTAWNGDSAVGFLARGLPGFPKALARDADELFLVRNSLAHNHIWLMEGTAASGVFTAAGIKKLRGRNPPGKAPISRDRRVTHPHRLNLVPELVGYSDVRKALSILVRVLDALAATETNMMSAADSTRVELGPASAPRLRAFARMPRQQPRRMWRPRDVGTGQD